MVTGVAITVVTVQANILGTETVVEMDTTRTDMGIKMDTIMDTKTKSWVLSSTVAEWADTVASTTVPWYRTTMGTSITPVESPMDAEGISMTNPTEMDTVVEG